MSVEIGSREGIEVLGIMAADNNNVPGYYSIGRYSAVVQNSAL